MMKSDATGEGAFQDTDGHIVEVDTTDFDRLTAIWETSVRATHDFLEDRDIHFLRPLVRNEFLAMVTLRGYLEQGALVGFIGVLDGKIEMLFIDSATRGRGIGRQLATYAIEHLGATTVDVNEQNPQAIGFYQHLGFRVIGRQAVDGMGKPFPLLNMAL